MLILGFCLSGGKGPLAEEEERLFKLRQEKEELVQKEITKQRQMFEREAREGQLDKLCATPFGVDVVGITEFIALTGALVGGMLNDPCLYPPLTGLMHIELQLSLDQGFLVAASFMFLLAGPCHLHSFKLFLACALQSSWSLLYFGSSLHIASCGSLHKFCRFLSTAAQA